MYFGKNFSLLCVLGPIAMVIRKSKLEQLLRVYEDVESVLRNLRQKEGQMDESSSIDVRKLIEQLARSKRRIKSKIGNTLLLEKQNIKRRIKNFASDLSSRR